MVNILLNFAHLCLAISPFSAIDGDSVKKAMLGSSVAIEGGLSGVEWGGDRDVGEESLEKEGKGTMSSSPGGFVDFAPESSKRITRANY